MAWVEAGRGDPIVFLHGNPSSSYLWRDVLPHVEALGRCIAPDLIGMGDSDRLTPSGPGRYGFAESYRHLEGFLDGLGIRERVTLVLHDWGAALGFHWANRHRAAVRGIAYCEACAFPLARARLPAWAPAMIEAVRSEAGEASILQGDRFFSELLPRFAPLRGWDEEVWAEYCRPFAEPGEARRPILSWMNSLPLDGEPSEVAQAMASFLAWLPEADLPKLRIDAEPGALRHMAPPGFGEGWRHQEVVSVPGTHFVPEDSADALGLALAAWIRRLPS
jgi:haloalkane dehalogenase